MMMMKFPLLTLRMLLSMMLFFTVFGAQAQDKTRLIGNKPRNGSSNNTFGVIKGDQVGIKMNAGKKPVQLLVLNFGADNRNDDVVKFKVNVYEFNSEDHGENFVKQDVLGEMPKGKSRINVDLTPFHIVVSGSILVSIEFIKTNNGREAAFNMGLLNGGTYHYEAGEWKKIPVAGVDFNVLVKKLK
jgi:hypothetical protein